MTDGGPAQFKNRRRPLFIARLLAPLLWALAILCLSLTSSPPEIPGLFGWDKLLHAGAYGLLALLVIQFLFIYLPNRLPLYLATSTICVFFGGLLEILQLAGNAGRTAEWWDMVADIIGVALACVIFRQLSSAFSKQVEGRGHDDG